MLPLLRPDEPGAGGDPCGSWPAAPDVNHLDGALRRRDASPRQRVRRSSGVARAGRALLARHVHPDRQSADLGVTWSSAAPRQPQETDLPGFIGVARVLGRNWCSAADRPRQRSCIVDAPGSVLGAAPPVAPATWSWGSEIVVAPATQPAGHRRADLPVHGHGRRAPSIDAGGRLVAGSSGLDLPDEANLGTGDHRFVVSCRERPRDRARRRAEGLLAPAISLRVGRASTSLRSWTTGRRPTSRRGRTRLPACTPRRRCPGSRRAQWWVLVCLVRTGRQRRARAAACRYARRVPG